MEDAMFNHGLLVRPNSVTSSPVRHSYCVAAGGAEMRPVGRHGAALRAEAAGTCGNRVGRNIDMTLRRASPNQGDEPANDGPSEEKIHDENTSRVGFVPPNQRREEIDQNRENHEKHFRTPSGSIRPKAKHTNLFCLTIRGASLVCSARPAQHNSMRSSSHAVLLVRFLL